MRRRIQCLSLLAIFLIGCSKDETNNAPPPLEVNVSNPQVDNIVEWDEYTGRFQAEKTVEIRSRVGGYLEQVRFKDGQIVEKGQTLFIIDQRPFKIALEQAKADLNASNAEFLQAQSNFNRVKSLQDSRAISTEEYEVREQNMRAAAARKAAAQSRVDQASLNLGFTTIKSPIKGRISRKLVNVGNLITGDNANGTLLTTVVSLDPIHFYFEGSEADLLRYIRLDRTNERSSSRDTPNPVLIKLQDETDFNHKGSMDFVDNQLDFSTGTIQGRALVPNPNYVIEAGMFGRARLLGSAEHKAILIPEKIIQADQTRRFVYVLSDSSTVEVRVLSLGRFFSETTMRAVLDGITEEDQIITNRLQFLRPGMKVSANKTSMITSNDKP
ncbi:MAG: efflux RND transporter periplasmic adaptor subunit [Bacteroidota bacterium]